MALERVTLRLPRHVIAAYDEADGNRSAMMRRRLTEAVADDEIQNVPPDLKTLAEREQIVDSARLDRERGKFRENSYEFFAERWEAGATTITDAEDLASSWKREAELYGAGYVAWIDAILEWWRDHWRIDPPPEEFADPTEIHARVDPGAVELDERLIERVEEAKESGKSKGEILTRLRQYHPDARAQRAVSEVF